MRFDVLFWLYNAQTACCFSVSDNHGQTKDVIWLSQHKIPLNVKKTEIVIFKSTQKKLAGDLKIKLCGKRLYPTESVKYLGVKIDTNLTANAVLFKMRKYVSLKILRSIYFAIFDFYLSYCCLHSEF